MARLRLQTWRRMPGRVLLFLVNLVAATALVFEGYNQGVLGTVSATPGFIDMAGLGSDGIVDNPTKQGGLAAAYYFGGIWGCFVGGWIGDRLGRKRGVLVGNMFGMIGAALMASSINSDMFLCARVIAGLGIGFINAIIPPWVSELSQAHDRGSAFSLVFVANFLGIVIAYWINFGVRDTGDQFRWRFPLAWMMVPLLIVTMTIPLLPESPRWLIANGRRDEAVEILCKLRGDAKPDDSSIRLEIEQLDTIVASTHHKRNDLINICQGGRFSGPLHLGRRAAMGFALQWIQQWTGILAIAAWAGTLFRLAGFDSYKALWLAGLVNTLGVPGTAAAALVIDRVGRVKSLLVSFVTQGVSLFLVAALIKTGQDAAGRGETDLSQRLGTAATSFVFVYIWFFCMFNIVPCWIYGTEIWPQEIRAKGYSFTICGWAVGCGMTQFVIPIMLDRLGWATYVFFGAMNFFSMPVVWYLFPETSERGLEEVNLLFCSGSLLVGENLKEFDRRVERAGGHVSLAARELFKEADEFEKRMVREERGDDDEEEEENTTAVNERAERRVASREMSGQSDGTGATGASGEIGSGDIVEKKRVETCGVKVI